MDFFNMKSNQLLTMFYIMANIISIIMASILLIKTIKYKQTIYKCFNSMIIFIIIYFIGDAIWAIGYFGLTHNNEIILKLSRMTYYSASNIIALSWLLYVLLKFNPHLNLRKYKKLFFIPTIISLISTIIICIFLNPARKDIYGYLTVLALILVPFIYIISSGIYVITKYHSSNDEVDRKNLLLFALWPLTVIIVSVLQVFFAEIPIYCFGAIIVSLYLYIYNQESYIFIDTLTGVNNRSMLNKYIKEIIKTESTYYILMVDINRFKSINDTKGHLEGDRALIYFANTLKKVLDHHKCFLARYGGDEFTIIYKTNDEKAIIDLMNEIHNELLNSKSELRYELSTSIGYSIIDKNQDIDKSIEKADSMLYINKENAHKLELIEKDFK